MGRFYEERRLCEDLNALFQTMEIRCNILLGLKLKYVAIYLFCIRLSF